MSTKANFKAIVLILTVALTSLFISPSEATTFSDALTLSSATMSQQVGETLTSGSVVAQVSFLSGAIGDTYTVTSSLVSAPAGNTRLPVLELFETTSAEVYSGSSPNRLNANSVIQANVQAKISPLGTPPLAAYARFHVYMDAPEKAGTYVVKITPAVLGGGGTLAATAQTLTITVAGTPHIFSDTLMLSSATMSQGAGETSTSNSSVVTVSYLSTGFGDTFSVIASLVSAPAGSTSLPNLRLTETTNAQIWNSNYVGPLSLYSEIQSNTAAMITPNSGGAIAVTAKFQVYMNAPTRNGTYVLRITPTTASNGSLASTAQSLTITVTGGSAPEAPLPPETSTPDTYTASINITSALTSQLTSKNQTTNDLFVNLNSYSTNSGDTASVTAYLISAPAGNVALPVLELVQTSNSQIDATARFSSAQSVGTKFQSSSPAYMSAQSAPSAMSARFKLYLDNPKKQGTYVVRIQPRIVSGVGTAPTNGLIVTFTVTRDSDSYPTRADVILSNPGDITNKTDAEIFASKVIDNTNEVAVIRTVMRSVNGTQTTLDSYTAVITGVGVIGSAPLSNNINTSALGRAIQVRAGDAVTVYADGSAGVGTVTITTFDGTVVGVKSVNFVDLSNQSTALLSLSFSSFPEKGSLVTVSALVNLPGSVRFTNNGKTLGSCARVTATGSPKTAICGWKPPVSGQVKITATFVPSDTAIAPITQMKTIAIGRRSGPR